MHDALRSQRRGHIVIERSLDLGEGVAMLRQRFSGDDTRLIITHDACMRSLVEVRRGRLVFPLARGDVVAPPRFILAMPPHSLLALRFEHAEVVADGMSAVRRLDRHAVPAIEVASEEAPTIRRTVAAGGAVLAQLDPDAGVAAALVRARTALHAAIGAVAPVRIAAAAAGMAPETLARRFADAYRITPKRYCHRARLFDAAVLLLEGAPVVDAALRAGFNDLTRFYAQFRRLLGGTPGDYARVLPRSETAKIGARGLARVPA